MATVKQRQVSKAAVEAARKQWADVARERGWYVEPFFIQVWIDRAGNIADSVGHRGMAEAKADLFVDYSTDRVIDPKRITLTD